eukprot:8853481-Pyramimonas_sp.AAC.1
MSRTTRSLASVVPSTHSNLFLGLCSLAASWLSGLTSRVATPRWMTFLPGAFSWTARAARMRLQ